MTILIDVFLGNHAMVFDDLLQIVLCDPGLTTSQPTPYVLQVAYQQKQQSVASSSRMLSLVNDATTILIIGVNNTFVLPDGNPITAFGGGVSMPGTLTQPITIWVDVTEAGGHGYHVRDTDGATIYLPRPVTVYHELAHAYHMLLGDFPANKQAREVQAIHDENTFRAQIFIPLRHPTDHYGDTGAPSHGGQTFPTCKPVYPGFNWDCIVASAAVGSPHAPQVEELRRARREYRSLSLWATLISEPVLDLYRKFSPGVVRDMNTDPALRQAMLLYAVQPIFHLVQIAESYLRAEADDDELMAALDRSVGEYVADLSKAGVSPRTLATAAEGAAFAARALGADRAAAAVHASHGEMPGDLYGYLASTIAPKGSEAVGYAWAFEGIALFLGQAVAKGVDQRGVTPAFLDALGAWLARLPIPTGALLSIADARVELKVFAERVFTRPHARAQFAQHLLARWPAASVPELRSLFSDLHYLRPDHDTTE